MIRLAIRVRADRAEHALADLLPILQAGAEEREVDGDVEYSLYAPEGELPPLEDIRALAGDALVEVTREGVPEGWERRWHEFLRPVRVRDLVVRPPWVDGSPDDLVIDPGVFFGAGTHATTRLCLELLLDAPPGGALCDWGAGTGILAIAAARRGWDPVTAVDVDPAAPAVIEANAARNGVRVAAARHDLREAPPPWAPVVVANLTRTLLLRAAEMIERPPEPLRAAEMIARPPVLLLASGMLVDEVDEVVAAYERLGLRERRRVEGGEWAGVALA